MASPKKTDNNGYQLGLSPRPTGNPQARFRRMDLLPRLDGYTLQPNTCGFEAGNGNALTCVSLGYTCSFTDGYVGCCDPASCRGAQTACIDYSASRAGSCTGSRVLCCKTSSEGACFTHYISTTIADGKYSTFKALDCSAASGTDILLDYDPRWSRDHLSTSSTTSTSGRSTTSSTSATATATSNNNGGGGNSTPVGAIVGGVIGGVAALALVAIAVFLILKRRGKSPTHIPSAAPHPNPQQPPMDQQGPHSQIYTAAYPNQGPHSQEQYDPRVYNFNQPPIYPNAGQYYQQHPQQGPSQGLPEQQMLQRTRDLFGGYQASSINTATEQQHVESTLNPGEKIDVTRETIILGPTSELETVAPLGGEANRAELGGTKSPT